ncbi:MAG: twin-arginine translocase TatA/TatE family subunit [Chloroflexi bacterium]|jgi:Sec-independent protein translocase protein TatA|nr:twin-arginine translocase TatA/TatE family subunit [Chloroflexota bacterium]
MIFGLDVLIVLIVVLVIVLIWRGPKTLPALGAMFGRGVKSVRDEVEGTLDDDDPKPGA